ncbi:MAG TPA: head GIN domain-containing protein [Tepidisphaeraceae bacterium]|jgi:hypothetical protein|nr:head GIN domain-containing protein [Tepidisphaeraceae bacterium]
MRCINCWLATLGLVLLCLLALNSRGAFNSGIRGSGTSQAETRQVQPFDSIRLDGVADVDVSISDHTELIVSADDNLLQSIQTTVSGGTLTISEKQNISPKSNIKITIKTPNLKSTSLSGAGNFNVNGLKDSSFSVNVSGAGNITASGQVDTLTVKLSGAGRIDLADLLAKDTTITVSGAGSAKINSTDTLNASVSGVGSIAYKGSPNLTEQVSGVGTINHVP